MTPRPDGVLTIGTMETRGYVGIGLDLRLLAELGCRAQAVVVAVSAQGPGPPALAEIPAALVEAQLASVDRAAVAAVRIGALPSRGAIAVVARALEDFAGLPVVLDPVVASTRGFPLVREETLGALRDVLLPLATVTTPNLAEAAALSGVPTAADDDDAVLRAALALVDRGARAVLVTGGHRAGEPVDLFVDAARRSHRFAAPRIARDMRGTGCALAVFLAAELASSAPGPAARPDVLTAIERARQRVRTKIAHARRVGDQWVAS